LEKIVITMFGQIPAGSWIYIGPPGCLAGNQETFAEAGAKTGQGSLQRTITLTVIMGSIEGDQPLAGTMNGGVALVVEVDEKRIDRRIADRYCDRKTDNLEEALKWAREAAGAGQPLSIGLLGNAAAVYPELLRRDFIPDFVTDQTSAHDILNGYIPRGYTPQEAEKLREKDPKGYQEKALDSIKEHVRAMLEMQKRGAVTFDYGNNIREQARKRGLENAFDFPGFVPAFIRPLFCEGKGPFRWVAISGEEEDIYKIDRKIKELFPEDERLLRWIDMAGERVSFQGLPSRICWLGYGDRARLGVEMNRMVGRGELAGPIVIGRDHLDTGSVASPYRETEGMKDGSDAIGDWPILNALLNTSAGASWVSVHHGGGVGIGYSLHAGMVVVADGTQKAEERLERVLTCDPGTGVVRHADAGYEEAINTARDKGIQIP